MRKTVLSLILALSALLCLMSCARENVNVLSVVPQAFVTESGRMGMSLWFRVEGYDEAQTLELRSPDNEFTWNMRVGSARLNGLAYLGSSDAVMPRSIDLPQGTWSYVLVFRDGRTEEGSFDAVYRDADGALDRSLSQSLPYYDEISNLTVISDVPSNSMVQLGL